MFALALGFALGSATPMVATAPVGDTTVRIGRATRVSVSTLTRSVRLLGVTGDRVTVTGASFEHDGDVVEISGSPLGPSRGDGPITVSVPTWAEVEVTSVQGSVSIANAPARLMVGVVDGRISVDGGADRMTLSGTGEISVRNFAGRQLTIGGVAGDIDVRNATGTVEVASVSGDLSLVGLTGGDIRAESTSGDISWSGGLARDGYYRFVTHDGDVELALPKAVDAQIEVETFSGSFHSAIAAVTSGDDDSAVGRRIVVRYGSGSARVRVESFSGDVRVVRSKR